MTQAVVTTTQIHLDATGTVLTSPTPWELGYPERNGGVLTRIATGVDSGTGMFLSFYPPV